MEESKENINTEKNDGEKIFAAERAEKEELYGDDGMKNEFDAAKETESVVAWIRDFFRVNGAGCKAVVAVSGGKDSSVVAALCVSALGRENVHGLLLPNGEQADIDSSKLLVQHLGIEYSVINIKSMYEEALAEIEKNIPEPISDQTVTNLPARLRMAVTYAAAQSMNGRVANTCNLSEDWVGYSTRYGDAAGDFSPMSRFTTEEVRAIGRILGLPDELVDKVPIDGLTPYTDEENMGFSYAVLDRYIRTGICEDREIKDKIDKRHRANLFKMSMMPFYEYGGEIKADQ